VTGFHWYAIGRHRKQNECQRTVLQWVEEIVCRYLGYEIHRLKQLEDENRRLKELAARMTLDKQILQNVL
jgi:hypothetical protein